MALSPEEIQSFRKEVSAWLAQNFPKSLAGKATELNLGKNIQGEHAQDADNWRKRLAEKGWGAPTWPKEYGGAALNHKQVSLELEGKSQILLFQD